MNDESTLSEHPLSFYLITSYNVEKRFVNIFQGGNKLYLTIDGWIEFRLQLQKAIIILRMARKRTKY